jgi:hypothetical protein
MSRAKTNHINGSRLNDEDDVGKRTQAGERYCILTIINHLMVSGSLLKITTFYNI